MWMTWISLALLLFWAVGAYNRLVRLRSAAIQAFGALDTHLLRFVALLGEYANTRNASDLPPADPHHALQAATTQYGASLAVLRAQPLDAAAAGALVAARLVLDTAWQGVVHEAARLNEGVAPPTLANWVQQREQLLLQLAPAAQQFADTVARYNQAIGQFPAQLLAWLFGFRKAQAL